ncbi:hypothetical protein AVEN_69343-1 [Araneus ventricosus]|uniref:Uncharacterized protein n=1 Tax=Araneus ventricosus TaxID=182803 RepID=A0A4Y2X949_ARAVE|nr:hypothetical protein AVEN_69343-1 [Araneus ventricosus]
MTESEATFQGALTQGFPKNRSAQGHGPEKQTAADYLLAFPSVSFLSHSFERRVLVDTLYLSLRKGKKTAIKTLRTAALWLSNHLPEKGLLVN